MCRSLKPWRKFPPRAYGHPSGEYLLVGEAPGRASWEKRRRFTGPAGLLIRRALTAVGHPRYRDLEDLFYMTDIVKCHPGRMQASCSTTQAGPNRSPRSSEVRACKPFLVRELNVLHPQVIITFGKQAAATIDLAIAECTKHGRMARWNPDRITFPHPSPRNQRTILRLYPSMAAFERAIVEAFRGVILRLDSCNKPQVDGR